MQIWTKTFVILGQENPVAMKKDVSKLAGGIMSVVIPKKKEKIAFLRHL
jgi:hypothetical protein